MLITNAKGIDAKYFEETMAQAKRFFALPEEKKMEVFTGLVPNEYVGYHPMKCYNRNGWKHQGESTIFSTSSLSLTSASRLERGLQLGI